MYFTQGQGFVGDVCALTFRSHTGWSSPFDVPSIGFDVRGDVKIFDFGLAKEFDPKTAVDGAYKLTGDTGSPRYMAVEVALNQPYNETCDVYSFCVLLWQILKLETPFEGFTMNMFDKKVVRGGVRPKVEDKWPAEIRNLLKDGWGDWTSRPSMDDVCTVLREEINRNSDEEIVDTLDASRKSEMSLRRGGS
jgi:serine/threonine protein kinase